MIKSRVKILSPRGVKLLEDFVYKRVDLDAFYNAFEDFIAELEVAPKWTLEAKALFRLELYLHEVSDRLRDIEEAYTYARDLLEAEGPMSAPLERCPNKNC